MNSEAAEEEYTGEEEFAPEDYPEQYEQEQKQVQKQVQKQLQKQLLNSIRKRNSDKTRKLKKQLAKLQGLLSAKPLPTFQTRTQANYTRKQRNEILRKLRRGEKVLGWQMPAKPVNAAPSSVPVLNERIRAVIINLETRLAECEKAKKALEAKCVNAAGAPVEEENDEENYEENENQPEELRAQQRRGGRRRKTKRRAHKHAKKTIRRSGRR